MPRYQYAHIQEIGRGSAIIHADTVQEVPTTFIALNRLGREGWELVAVIENQRAAADLPNRDFFLKRQLDDEGPH